MSVRYDSRTGEGTFGRPHGTYDQPTMLDQVFSSVIPKIVEGGAGLAIPQLGMALFVKELAEQPARDAADAGEGFIGRKVRGLVRAVAMVGGVETTESYFAEGGTASLGNEGGAGAGSEGAGSFGGGYTEAGGGGSIVGSSEET